MATIRFTLETITPLFLRGHDNKTPELRPPSVKGLLRYWWRASQVLPVSDLREKEAKLFGSASGETGGRSTVIVRIPPASLERGTFQPLPHPGGNNFRQEAFSPRQQFEVILRRTPRCPVSLERVGEIALLAFSLGGLGMRSRRGFGALQVRAIDDTPVDSAEPLLQEVRNVLASGNGQYEIAEDRIRRTGDRKPPYPWIRSVEEGKRRFEYASRAVTHIGEVTHRHTAKYDGADYAGSALGQRFASPVYVTVKHSPDGFWPLATMLHVPEATSKKLRGPDTRAEFKNAVLHE